MRVGEVAARLFPEVPATERERAALLLFASGFTGSGRAPLVGPDSDERLVALAADREGLTLTVRPAHPWAALADLHTDEVAAFAPHLLERVHVVWRSATSLSVWEDEQEGAVHAVIRSRGGWPAEEARESGLDLVAVALAALGGARPAVLQAARRGSLADAFIRGLR